MVAAITLYHPNLGAKSDLTFMNKKIKGCA